MMNSWNLFEVFVSKDFLVFASQQHSIQEEDEMGFAPNDLLEILNVQEFERKRHFRSFSSQWDK